MWPDWVWNLVPLALQSDALLMALCDLADYKAMIKHYCEGRFFFSFFFPCITFSKKLMQQKTNSYIPTSFFSVLFLFT